MTLSLWVPMHFTFYHAALPIRRFVAVSDLHANDQVRPRPGFSLRPTGRSQESCRGTELGTLAAIILASENRRILEVRTRAETRLEELTWISHQFACAGRSECAPPLVMSSDHLQQTLEPEISGRSRVASPVPPL